MKHLLIFISFVFFAMLVISQTVKDFEKTKSIPRTKIKYDIKPEFNEKVVKLAGDVGVCSIESPEDEYCGLEVLSPVIWVKNYGGGIVDSCRVMYRLDFYPPVIIYVDTEISAGDSIMIELNELEVNSGSHSIQFSAFFPNGEEDVDATNNSMSRTFEYSNGKQYIIELLTDNYANETSWILTNDADQTIASNGDIENATLYQDVLCLVPGCYTFSVFDSFGDGICGSYGDGYFAIIEADTKIEIATGCDYGDGTTVDFCVEADEGIPTANFSHGSVNSCTGEVNFYDNSSCNPVATAWLWNFGDGNTSTEQNPTHIYLMNGMYSVSLQVTNTNGTHTLSVPNYIEIQRYNPPFIADEFFCNYGENIVFQAPDGYDEIYWYIDPTTETPEIIYDSFTLENVITDTTIYYQSYDVVESQYVGLEDNSGDGGYFGFSIDRAVYFDAYTDITIKSTTVYASGAGERTITLKNSGGTVLDTRVIDIPDGESVIDLDFQVSEGTDYAIHVNTANNLAYTGDYGDPNIGYPFILPDLISITGNNYGEDFWYFFYNIEIVDGFSSACMSAIVPLNASLSEVNIELCEDTIVCAGNEAYLYSENEFVEYFWSNDSITQGIFTDVSGTYSLTVTDEYSCTAEGSVSISNFDTLLYSSSVQNVTDSDNPDGFAEVIIDSGSEPVEILWSCDSTSYSISGMEAGVYYYTLIDANGCEYPDSVTIGLISGIDSEISNNNIKLFPNPVSELLNITCNFENQTKLKLIDSSGRVLIDDKFENRDIVIDVSDLSSGVYFVEITNLGNRNVFKIFKQ